jgi:hypothetical protein
MKLHRLLPLLVALLGLSGCSDDCPDCDIVPCVEPVILPPELPGLLLPGRQTHLSFPADFARCEDARPSSVTAEIYGPDGALVADDISLSEGPQAELRFTPLQPGPYHVLVAFSPVGGIHQFDFHAVHDRSAEAASLTLPELCSSLERTLQGAWVCGTTVFRDDTPVAEFPGARLAVTGDVVWVVNNTQTLRFVDTGSALVQTHAVNRPPGPVAFLLPSANELLSLQDSRFVQYTAGTELTVASLTIPWIRGSTFGVLLRDADHVLAITHANGGGMRPNLVLEACPYQLTPSGPQRTQAPCINPAPESVAGSEPGVLWITGSSLSGNRAIVRWTWAAGRFEKQSSINLNANARFVDPPITFNGPSAAPVVHTLPSSRYPEPITAVATWSPTQQRIVLEQLDPDISEISTSPSFYWGRVPPLTSNTTRVRIRPPTP